MAALSMKIEMRVSCSGLPKMDITSKTDAFVIIKAKAGSAWVAVAQTEVIKDDQSPSFVSQIILDYRFEEVQPMKIEVWDYDETTAHDLIGVVEVPLARIFAARSLTFSLGPHKGTITIATSPYKEVNDIFRVQFQAARLAAKDAGFLGIGGKSDPYLVISRLNPDTSRMKVFTSNTVMKELNPTWNVADIRVSALCNGDYSAPLILEVWDYDAHSDHDLIGMTAPVTFQELLDSVPSSRGFPLMDPKKSGKKGYTDSGVVSIRTAEVIRIPSFTDYLYGGCQLNMVAAVDFTGSNGPPAAPTSLHYSPDRIAPTQYLQAIAACGSVLLEYDSDKAVPYFGFGGQLPDGTTSHCFAMNGNPVRPEVVGLEGLAAAYWQALSVIRLSGPTFFAPIIRKTIELANKEFVTQASQKYTVLLLLTDGQFNDQPETISAIVDASYHPMSIIIVGIGEADFSGMELLDCDKGLLRSGSKTAARDIVQFVAFRDFKAANAAALLASAVLKEVPAQLVAYFRQNHITPNVPTAPVAHGAGAVTL